MEDNLMRIFASDRIRGLMQSIGMEQGEAIEHRMVNNAIEKAQRKVEGHNFDIRKNLLEYDDVANDQRQVIYQQRRELMAAEDISETITSIREEVVMELVSDQYIPPMSIEEQWDVAGLEQALVTDFASRQPMAQWLEEDDELNEESLRSASSRRSRRSTRPRRPSGRPRASTCAWWRSRSCCRSSTSAGRSTWR
jgi:preprotein translocase subunit SecA